jgi:hypothetical protein
MREDDAVRLVRPAVHHPVRRLITFILILAAVCALAAILGAAPAPAQVRIFAG